MDNQLAKDIIKVSVVNVNRDELIELMYYLDCNSWLWEREISEENIEEYILEENREKDIVW